MKNFKPAPKTASNYLFQWKDCANISNKMANHEVSKFVNDKGNTSMQLLQKYKIFIHE